jgi:hypothetical protein
VSTVASSRISVKSSFASLVAHGLLEGGAQLRKLILSSDHRSVEPARDRRGARDDCQQPPGLDQFALPLQGERIERLGEHGVAHEPVRRVSDQDLAGARSCLEALCDDDGFAGDERMASRRVSGDDLPGADAGSRPDLDAVFGAQLLVQRGQRLPELAGGANRPQRVVLVDDRDPERRHDRVADELLDRPAVVLDDAADLDEVARDDAPVRLRVEPLSERGRVDDVGEDDGDRLAHLTRRSRLLERSPTGEAKPRVNWIGLAAAETNGHVPPVWNQEASEYTGRLG